MTECHEPIHFQPRTAIKIKLQGGEEEEEEEECGTPGHMLAECTCSDGCWRPLPGEWGLRAKCASVTIRVNLVLMFLLQ
jgi:hypothetical protein